MQGTLGMAVSLTVCDARGAVMRLTQVACASQPIVLVPVMCSRVCKHQQPPTDNCLWPHRKIKYTIFLRMHLCCMLLTPQDPYFNEPAVELMRGTTEGSITSMR